MNDSLLLYLRLDVSRAQYRTIILEMKFEIQTKEVTCPRTHNSSAVGPELEPRSLNCQFSVFLPSLCSFRPQWMSEESTSLVLSFQPGGTYFNGQDSSASLLSLSTGPSTLWECRLVSQLMECLSSLKPWKWPGWSFCLLRPRWASARPLRSFTTLQTPRAVVLQSPPSPSYTSPFLLPFPIGISQLRLLQTWIWKESAQTNSIHQGVRYLAPPGLPF